MYFLKQAQNFFVKILKKNYQKAELASNLIQLEAFRLTFIFQRTVGRRGFEGEPRVFEITAYRIRKENFEKHRERWKQGDAPG